jgi:pyruvate dehydrogenase E2 component (dihydrolipoamide acetyltransferase)
MAKVMIDLARVGLVMETAKVVGWLKKVGDEVAVGEPLLEIETEKSVVEVEASTAGRLVEILVAPGDEIEVGANIACIDDGRDEPADAPAKAEPAKPAAAAAAPAAVPVKAASAAPGSRVVASPLARREAGALGVELAAVAGSGPAGRVRLADVEQAAAGQAGGPARQPLSPMRRAVARSMTLSNATVPQFNVSSAVDWTAVQAARRQRAGEAKPSVNDFVLAATARALLEFPALNAVFVGSADSAHAHIQPSSGAHIGLVVAVDEGLLVPVLRHVERLGLAEIAAQRAEVTERARQGRLRREEAGGATFTISNLGAQGPDRFTGMLNPPESGLLAIGRMREAPVVRDGAVVVRPVSELTLTVDHRVADGRLASEFLARVVAILQEDGAGAA